MHDHSKHTVIENGTEFDGSVRSECPITLSGKLKGQVSAPALMVTPSGSVQGQIKVSQLRAQGEIAGTIEAEAVELSGRVHDQTVIRARTLEVALTQTSGGVQVTFGNCELQVGDPAARTAPSAKRAKESGDTPANDRRGDKPAAKPAGGSNEQDLVEALSDLMK
jgi:cytoskeletal protein CcmA (bactofilin family)